MAFVVDFTFQQNPESGEYEYREECATFSEALQLAMRWERQHYAWDNAELHDRWTEEAYRRIWQRGNDHIASHTTITEI